MSENKSAAIFGGTFNPPHMGHILMAEELSKDERFDRIMVMPSFIPPHKTGYFASPYHRLEMCKAVFSKIDKVTVSDFELNLKEKSYTVLTLEKLRDEGIKNPYLVIGADSLVNFSTWFRYKDILKLANLIVYRRTGISEEELLSARKALEENGGNISILDICPPEISSTHIRNVCLAGGTLRGLVAPETEKYIKENKLYLRDEFMEPQFSTKCTEYRKKYDNYVKMLKENLTEKRFYHTLCVAKEAVRLAEKYGVNTEKAFLAGLLHDICKDMDKEIQLQLFKEFGIMLDSVVLNAPKLWHSYLGAAYIKNKLGINDEEIINAVKYHTTARKGMAPLEKIIYLADFTSEERDYEGVEDMRRAVNISVEKAMYEALKFSVEDLKEKGATIHKDTLAAYEEVLANKN